jgi:hypothetical protein
VVQSFPRNRRRFRPGTTRLKWPCGRSRLHRRHRRYRGGGYRRRPPGLVRLAPRRPTKASTSQLGSNAERLSPRLRRSGPSSRPVLPSLLAHRASRPAPPEPPSLLSTLTTDAPVAAALKTSALIGAGTEECGLDLLPTRRQEWSDDFPLVWRDGWFSTAA